MRRLVEIAVSAALGAVVAIVGAVAHRSIPPIAVILCCVLVLLATVFVRAWAGWTAVLSFAVPFVVLTYVFTLHGPGGDLLIAGDALGYSWLYGGAGAVVLACVMPPSWIGRAHRVESA